MKLKKNILVPLSSLLQKTLYRLSQKRKGLFISILLLSGQYLLGQTKLPVIKANSVKVAINDGGVVDKNAWTLSPESRPDVFIADRTRKTKWVTFYTDLDSIRVKVKPGSCFSFIIFLHGKDSCYTQIRSAIPAKKKQQRQKATHDTIPFTLTAYNAIHVKSILNDRDTLNLHFDIGSFDFRLTRDAILKRTKLLSNQPEALAGKVKPNYSMLEKVSKIQMGKIVWNDPELVPTGFTAHGMDGRFGWNIFEDKIVEIDYEKELLIIHSQLPKNKKGYIRSNIEFIRSFVCLKGTMKIENKEYTGNFLFDTGSDQALILDSAWVAKQNFPKNLKLIKSSSFKDPRGVIYETKVVLCPGLKVNTFSLTHIPTTLLATKNPVGFEVNYFGNDLLKRFNTLLDLKNDHIYLKPNKRMNQSYREHS